MARVFAIELRRAFVSRRFFLALGLLVFVVVAHVAISVAPAAGEQEMYIELTGYPLSVYNRWIGGWPGTVFPTLYFFLLPLAVCIPYSDSKYVDEETGLTAQICSRVTPSFYYLSKYFAVFLVGAVVACVPLILDFVLTMLFLPLVQPSAASGLFPIFSYSMWGDIYYSDPLRYNAQYLAVIAVTSGLLACVPLVLSRVLYSRAIVTCSSLFSCVVLNYLFGNSEHIALVPTVFMRPDQPQWGLDFPSIVLTLGVLLTIVAISAILSWRRYESL